MTEATSIATIFENFAIDHTPDGWPAVQQMHLNAAAAELRRLQTAEDEQLTALGACRDAMPHTAANISGAIGCPLTVPETVSLLVSQLQTERTARQAAQIENEALKARIVASGVAERRAVREAVLAEREACAQAAEGFEANRDWVPGSLWGNLRAEVAAAIRAGVQHDKT